MEQKKRKRLEKTGCNAGSASTFLGLTHEEEQLVEMKLALGSRLQKLDSRTLTFYLWPSAAACSSDPPASRPNAHVDVHLSVTKTYMITEARSKLPDLVDEVVAGSEVELTRRGKRVAVVMSAARHARLREQRVAFMTAYATFRAKHDLAGVGLEPSFARALRERDTGPITDRLLV